MSCLRQRARLLDVAVAAACLGLVTVPLIPSVFATAKPVIESGATVDEQVVETVLISHPINGSYHVRRSGRSTGSVGWDVYTTSAQGFKLVVSSPHDPALRDTSGDADVPDLGTALHTWSVDDGDNRFGFSASGPFVRSTYDGGRRWRGFDGPSALEVARHTGSPAATNRTTVRLRAELNDELAEGATPSADVVATAVVQL